MTFIHRAVGCSQNVRLRSANRGNSYNTWNVNTSGNVNNNNASNANRFSPDCITPRNHTADSQNQRIFMMVQGAECPADKAKQYEGDGSVA